MEEKEIGYVIDVRDYLISLNGLPSVRLNEIVISSNGIRAVVFSLNENLVQCLLLDNVKVKPKQEFTRTHQELTLSAGSYLLGRTINPLGVPIDGKGRLPQSDSQLKVNSLAKGISSREFIKTQFDTGVSTVDMLVPLAKGQRELIMGGARSGKTSFLIDTIVNQNKDQSNNKTICILALIGKPIVEIRRIVDTLRSNNVLTSTIIIAASSAEKAPLVYLTPYVAMSIAEFFQKQGQDVLLILDDLGLHAKYYREITLLTNRAPGRESYPGDIFYQHARVLERAGHFRKEAGGGSITALPVIETSIDETAGFIQTNLMSMTDGHLLFNSGLRHRGQNPAIEVSLSVSRVGYQTQILIQKQLADNIKSVLSKAEKLKTLSTFGSDVSQDTRLTLNQGDLINEILNQPPLTNIPKTIQIVFLGLVFTPFLASKKVDFLIIHKNQLLKELLTLDQKRLTVSFEKMTSLDQFFTWLKPLSQKLEKDIK